MLALKFLFTLTIAIVIVFFLVINGQSVDINYYNYSLEFKTISLPLSLILVALTLSGFLLAWVLGIIEQIKLKGRLRKQNKRVKEMEKELESLRGPEKGYAPPHIEEDTKEPPPPLISEDDGKETGSDEIREEEDVKEGDESEKVDIPSAPDVVPSSS